MFSVPSVYRSGFIPKLETDEDELLQNPDAVSGASIPGLEDAPVVDTPEGPMVAIPEPGDEPDYSAMDYATLSTPRGMGVDEPEPSREPYADKAFWRNLLAGQAADLKAFNQSMHGVAYDPQATAASFREANDPLVAYEDELAKFRARKEERARSAQAAALAEKQARDEAFRNRQLASQEARAAAAIEAANKRNQEIIEAQNKRAADRLAAKGKKGGNGGAGTIKQPPGVKSGDPNEQLGFGVTRKMLDDADFTELQRAGLEDALKKGDKVRVAQYINEEAKLASQKAAEGKATVDDYANIIKMTQKLRKVKKGKDGFIKGLGGSSSDRAYFADLPSDGGQGGGSGSYAESAVGAIANLSADKESQVNRQLYTMLADEVRKDKYGTSFTGGEKSQYRKTFGMEATADPSLRVGTLDMIENKARIGLANMERKRRSRESILQSLDKAGAFSGGSQSTPAAAPSGGGGGGGTIMLSKKGGPPKPTPLDLAKRLMQKKPDVYKQVKQ